MLDALRRGAQGWLAKILFAILIVSFGVFWNVSGSLRNFGRDAVAHVGSEPITGMQFQRAFQSYMRALQDQSGQKFTPEQAVMYGIDRETLNQLVAQSAVKQHAHDLGLGLSDQAIVDGLKRDPNFQGPDGKFSQSGFNNMLQQLNMSEQTFFAIRREDEVRRQITDAMRAALVAPVPLITSLSGFRDETRTIEFVQLEPKKVTVAEPDDAKLKDTYEKNKARFMTPEFRKLAVLFLNVDDLKKGVTLSDDDLKAYYEKNKETYDKPERRRLQQIAFKTRADADAAHKALVEDKKNFMEVAKQYGATESDVNLGMIPKKKLIDQKIADAAFSIARDKVSDVIEGRFSFVILRVIEIDDEKKSTFDEVKDQVRDKLAGEKAAGLVHERIDLVEEGRNAGKTLKEIGTELKLSFLEADAVDKDNKTPDGKTGIDKPDAALVLKEAFQTPPGVQHDPVELATDSYAWFDVISVTDAKQKSFDEVKADAKAVYTEIETARLLDELAKTLADRLRSGEDIAKVAADAGGKADVVDTIKRNTSPPGLTTDAVKQAFGLPQGGAGYAETSDRASRTVFRVKEVKAADPPSKEQADKLAIEVRQQLENDYLSAYVTALKGKLGVTVNQAELRRASGIVEQ